ncbi:hypothetical protein PR048_027651 [Dryococelus australis]|uniref:DDE-1 domain-containing protein n=1 Tax=Dryococelus australis TaxID=614101 RepID=A0ABQ9GH31_9NEOP|nr:hypothetical protein PR048_027651 [Dryococelus australis]
MPDKKKRPEKDGMGQICAKKQMCVGNTYRKYSEYELKEAAKLVIQENVRIYKAAKVMNIPWSSLKRFIANNDDISTASLPKMERGFALSPEMEQKLLKFIINMQEFRFGLAVYQVRELAYKLAKTEGREHLMSDKTEVASKWWWNSYKESYGLSLRVPDNLSAYSASMSNPTMINDYFEKANHLLTTLGIKDNASRLWNGDETGLCYVVKPNKIVTEIGKRFEYKRVYADRAETHTLVGCICAHGTWIPPFVIFKGMRWNDNISEGSLPNSRTRLSPKGWITSELFLERFQFFIHSIPPNRPVVLFMDPLSSHITPEVIELDREQQIFILTLPSHTSHLLQPLDVGVYCALKCNWIKQLNSYMKKHPDKKPNRGNFY